MAARSSSGISRMRMKWAGTMNERVPRSRLDLGRARPGPRSAR